MYILPRIQKMSVVIKQPERKHRGENTNEYYNIRITRDYDVKSVQDGPLPISFNTTRTSPVLDDPSLYEMAVVRFYLPSELPIFIFDTDADGIGPHLQVGLEFEGAQFITTLIYDPYCPECIPANSVYYYQEFIDMINTALSTSFADMKAVKPLAPPTEAPYMTFNPTTRLCSLFAQTSYASALASPVNILMNIVMYNRFFPSLPMVQIRDIGIQTFIVLRVQDNKNNTTGTSVLPIPAGYFKMVQELPTLSLWNDLQTILLETDHIPVEPEYEPSENSTTRRLLTDFEPVVGVNDRVAFQFQPQGALRWYNLTSQYPLSNLDLKVL